MIDVFEKIISFLISSRTNKLSEAQLETQLRQNIENRKDKYIDLANKLSEDKSNNEILIRSLKSALESYLNAYEDACGKYIDNKIDKKRFKKTYFNEIKNIVENQNTCNYYNMVSSKYKATKKVYEEWFDIEK